MTAYTSWVAANALLSAALHFAVLGTLGEVIAHWVGRRRVGGLPCTAGQLLLKAVAWAVLGIVIKYGFALMKGGAHALVDQGLLPAALGSGIGYAALVSVLTNLLFGPQMMAFHRWEDNLILRRRGYAGIQRAWWTLIWFWIPAHTVTFSLPRDLQIGLAAVWSVVLGLILGLSAVRGAPARATSADRA
jgi:hypothetical protein